MESDPDDILTEKSPPKKHKSYAEIEVRPGRRKGAFSASQLLLMETPKSRGGSYRCTLGSHKSRSSSVVAKLKKPPNSSTSPTPNSKHLAIPSSLQSSPSSLHSSPSTVNTSSPTVPARWSPSSNDHRPYQEVENRSGATGGVMSALKDVTGLLNTLVKRVEENAKDIQSIQKALNSGTNSTESSPKHHVPSIVRNETRKVYAMLQEENENFGFVICPEVTYKSDVNASITTRVIKEVKSLNPAFQTCDIREAISTYYKSLCQKASVERRGLNAIRLKERKLRERLNRKLQERTIVLKSSVISLDNKKKWNEVLRFDMMSSEEDDSEEEDVIIVRPLPWRSPSVNDFFSTLDKRAKEKKTNQALRQMKTRVMGSASVRPKPKDPKIPKWALSRDQ